MQLFANQDLIISSVKDLNKRCPLERGHLSRCVTPVIGLSSRGQMGVWYQRLSRALAVMRSSFTGESVVDMTGSCEVGRATRGILCVTSFAGLDSRGWEKERACGARRL